MASFGGFVGANRLTLTSEEARSAQGPNKPTLSQHVMSCVSRNACRQYVQPAYTASVFVSHSLSPVLHQ